MKLTRRQAVAAVPSTSSVTVSFSASAQNGRAPVKRRSVRSTRHRSVCASQQRRLPRFCSSFSASTRSPFRSKSGRGNQQPRDRVRRSALASRLRSRRSDTSPAATSIPPCPSGSPRRGRSPRKKVIPYRIAQFVGGFVAAPRKRRRQPARARAGRRRRELPLHPGGHGHRRAVRDLRRLAPRHRAARQERHRRRNRHRRAGQGGLGTSAPLLDAAGNGIKGQHAAAFLSRRLGLDLFASKAEA
jgi:hypothetical protein